MAETKSAPRVEIYAQSNNSAVEEAETARLSTLQLQSREAMGYAEQIGLSALHAQDQRHMKAENAVAWCRAHGLIPLTAEEMTVWSYWLPMCFSSINDRPLSEGASRNNEAFRLSQYNHAENIPLHVRKHMVQIKDVFSGFEIYTPDDKSAVAHTDPILVGVIDWGRDKLDRVLLARWSESDANFVTFEDIEHIVGMRDGTWKWTPYALLGSIMRLHYTRKERGFGSACVVTAVAGLFVMMLIALISNSVLPLVLYGALIVPALALRYVRRLILKRQYPSVASNI